MEQTANLPKNFVMQVIGVWTENPDADARTLVLFAVNQGVNPQAPRFDLHRRLGRYCRPLE